LGIITAERNRYIVPVTFQIKIVTVTMFSLTKLKRFHRFRNLSPKKLKRLHCYLKQKFSGSIDLLISPHQKLKPLTLLGFLKDVIFISFVTNIVTSFLFLGSKKGFQKTEQLNLQLMCQKVLCGSGSLAPSIYPKYIILL
jgi:hypothetical protein